MPRLIRSTTHRSNNHAHCVLFTHFSLGQIHVLDSKESPANLGLVQNHLILQQTPPSQSFHFFYVCMYVCNICFMFCVFLNIVEQRSDIQHLTIILFQPCCAPNQGTIFLHPLSSCLVSCTSLHTLYFFYCFYMFFVFHSSCHDLFFCVWI